MSLTDLRLTYDNLESEGIQSLAEAMSAEGILPNLVRLDLDLQNPGDEALKALSQAFTSGAGKGLEELDLDGTGVGDKGVEDLAEALAAGACANVTRLHLICNEVNTISTGVLLHAVAGGACPKLQYLTFGESGSEGTFEAMERLLQRAGRGDVILYEF